MELSELDEGEYKQLLINSYKGTIPDQTKTPLAGPTDKATSLFEDYVKIEYDPQELENVLTLWKWYSISTSPLREVYNTALKNKKGLDNEDLSEMLNKIFNAGLSGKGTFTCGNPGYLTLLDLGLVIKDNRYRGLHLVQTNKEKAHELWKSKIYQSKRLEKTADSRLEELRKICEPADGKTKTPHIYEPSPEIETSALLFRKYGDPGKTPISQSRILSHPWNRESLYQNRITFEDIEMLKEYLPRGGLTNENVTEAKKRVTEEKMRKYQTQIELNGYVSLGPAKDSMAKRSVQPKTKQRQTDDCYLHLLEIERNTKKSGFHNGYRTEAIINPKKYNSLQNSSSEFPELYEDLLRVAYMVSCAEEFINPERRLKSFEISDIKFKARIKDPSRVKAATIYYLKSIIQSAEKNTYKTSGTYGWVFNTLGGQGFIKSYLSQLLTAANLSNDLVWEKIRLDISEGNFPEVYP